MFRLVYVQSYTPFYEYVWIKTPKTLLSVLPSLHDDLAECKMDTLQNYEVEHSFVVQKPDSQLGLYILERFCKQAAIDLAWHRGREYGFVDVEDVNERATNLTTIDEEITKKLPVHNLFCKRDLSHMDKLAIRAAACSNRNFTTKSTRDDMTLYQSKTKSIAKVLYEEERVWFDSQQVITKRKLAENQAKAIHSEM